MTADPKPAPKTEPKKIAAKKGPSKGGVNKSEEIRKLANTIKAKGEKPRPVEIIKILKKDGIVVSSPQVSMVLKRMGFRPRKRRKGGDGGVSAAPSSIRISGKVKIEDLVRAKKIATQLGGVDRAIAALQALKSFEG